MASEDYPLERRVYLHTAQLVSALGRGFAQWVVSPAGQAVVDRSQFVSFAIRPLSPGRVDKAPDEYQGDRRKGATAAGDAAIFDRAGSVRQSRTPGLERLAVYLQRPENVGSRVVLMGFANPQPASPMQSLFLSQERADYVSSELLALNMKVVTVRGFGGRMNLLEASQPASRYRNDRVEVWLRCRPPGHEPTSPPGRGPILSACASVCFSGAGSAGAAERGFFERRTGLREAES